MATTPAQLWRSLSWPNRITLMRILGVPPFVWLILKQSQWPPARWMALVLFVLMGLSDALDGYLARRHNMASKLGAVLDPVADKILITCAVILLAIDRVGVPGALVPDWTVVAVVAKDLWLVSGFIILSLIGVRIRVRPNRYGKGCTMSQIIMVTLILAAPDLDKLGIPASRFIPPILGGLVTGLSAMVIGSYTRYGLEQVAEHGLGQPEQSKQESSDDAVQ